MLQQQAVGRVLILVLVFASATLLGDEVIQWILEMIWEHGPTAYAWFCIIKGSPVLPKQKPGAPPEAEEIEKKD